MRALLLVALLGVLPASAQPARYWIVVGATVDAPVPEAASGRRALRGSGPQVDRLVAPEAVAALRALGVEPVVESRWLGAVSAALDADQREAVAALPFVRDVRPVGRLVTAELPGTGPDAQDVLLSPVLLPDPGPSAGQLQIVGVDDALAAGYTGAGVRLGFLDTRFDFGHPAFAHVVADGRLVATQDFTGLPQTDLHGLSTTSVALGFADGALIGPAHDAEVLAATTEYAPTETHAEEDSFVAGLEWLEANGVDVVSISLGYSTFDAGEGDFTYADMDGETTVFTRAVDRAASRGMVVVVSAGNEGARSWRYITAPADADSAITVGGVDSQGRHSPFSGYGPTADGRIKPDVVAQGSGVYVAFPNATYTYSNGTSFSAPMVAGIAAQLLQANPALTPIEVRDLLRQTASQAAAPDTVLGWGIVDAGAAVALARATAVEEDAPAAPRWRLAPSVVRAGGVLAVETPEPAALEVYDVVGRRVARLEAGAPRRTLTVPALPAGVYFVRPLGDRPLPALRIAVVD